MNKINNKFLLTEDKFMPELHLKQPGFTDGACESFTKHRERIKRFRETGNLKLLKRNELDRACFAHNAAYSNSKDIAKRTISDKTLKVRADEIVWNRGYDSYQIALASMVYKFFDKKTRSGGSVNEQLAEELHKPFTTKFKRRKVYARLKANTWTADLTEMEILSSKNKNIKHLCIMFSLNIFTKYAWVKPLKDEKGKTVINAFIEIEFESNCKPNKLWVDQGREFYNKLTHKWLDNNDILLYFKHNKDKLVTA